MPDTSPMPGRFRAAATSEQDWQQAADHLAAQLGADGGGRLGFLYVGEPLAPHLDGIAGALRERTGVIDWVAAAGYGVIGTGTEHYGAAGAAALVADIPAEGYRLFSGGADLGAEIRARHGGWLDDAVMPLAVTHLDPSHQGMAAALDSLVRETNGFAIGGLTAVTRGPAHLAGASLGGDASGVLLSPAAVEVATALTQGCSPIGPAHRITKVQSNVILEFDGRPALEVFKEDIGEILARDLRRVAGYIFAALPVAGSDTGDYTVRNLVSIDPASGGIAIAEKVEPGDRVMFCRRDPASAVEDMERMLGRLKARVGNRAVKGGLYISCAARGPNQFEAPKREIDLIRETFGDFPVAGFFANGELSRDRIYAYTGVLTLFL
jgi:small ligand-binding sensory domain FIST